MEQQHEYNETLALANYVCDVVSSRKLPKIHISELNQVMYWIELHFVELTGVKFLTEPFYVDQKRPYPFLQSVMSCYKNGKKTDTPLIDENYFNAPENSYHELAKNDVAVNLISEVLDFYFMHHKRDLRSVLLWSYTAVTAAKRLLSEKVKLVAVEVRDMEYEIKNHRLWQKQHGQYFSRYAKEN